MLCVIGRLRNRDGGFSSKYGAVSLLLFHSWYLVSWGLVQILLVFLLILHLAPDHLICACFPSSPHLAPLSVTSLGFWSVLVDLSLLNLTIENIYLTKEQIDKLFICPWQWPSIVALTNNKKLCLKTMINRSQKITPDAIFTNTELHLLSHPFKHMHTLVLFDYQSSYHHKTYKTQNMLYFSKAGNSRFVTFSFKFLYICTLWSWVFFEIVTICYKQQLGRYEGLHAHICTKQSFCCNLQSHQVRFPLR